jgi:hypothetical protein
MSKETWGTSESSPYRASFSDWDDSPRTQDRVAGRSEPEWRSTPIDPEVSELPKRRVPGPQSVPRLTPEFIELIGLVGTKVSALLIPANSSLPPTEVKFDQDRLCQYEVAGYDRDKVFLVEKNAERDYSMSNWLASEYVLHHSDAAKDPDSRMPSPAKLYGPVYVLGYDRLFEMITSLEEQLTELKHSLEWIDPSRGSD